MPKPSKQIIVDAIVKLIENGSSYTKVMAVNGRKWQMPERTFNRYWKTANEQHVARKEKLNKKVEALDTEMALESRKRAIMSADERKEYLSALISGDIKAKRPFVIGGKIMEYPEEPNHSDRIRAIAELNKMDGSYMPAKVDVTGQIDIKQITGMVVK